MADSDKNILITPSTGLTTQPTIEFTGFDNNKLTLTVLDDGTLSISGSSGQLFSIADSLVGTIFSVNDISGIPSIEVDDDGTVRLAEFAGNVLIGTATDNGTDKLQVNGSISATSFTGTVDWSNLSNLPDPTITLTGAVTGTATMTNLGNVSIATTATSDPTLTINGDASGSATFTNLGNATLTLTISDDSHNHTIANVDNLQTALDGKLSTSGGTLSGSLTIGDGTADTRLIIKRVDGTTGDDIQFFNGTTRVGEIGTTDTTWLRLNQQTNKNIYTPRYIRADAGFFVDGTAKGIDGSGNLIGMGTGSFSGQVTSTVAAGTAPFVVASDTVVANLNSDKVDGYDASRIFLTSLDTINSSAQDFNSFTTSGSYYVTNWSEAGDEVANGPTGSYGWGCLKVTQFNGPTFVLQEYWPHNTDISWSRVNWAGTWTAWRESWGSGNDGAGSGLDADLLDGQQGSHYLDWTNTTNKPTIYAEPGIFSGGGTPTLASGVTGAEIRALIGAGTSSTTGTVTSVEVAAGNALTGGGTITSSGTITINHEDTSTQASVDNSDGNVIQDVTLDTYGHVTALASVDLDGRYALKTNSEITGSAATGLTVTAAADNLGVLIKRNFDNADEPAALLIASDADGTDDLAFEIRGNATGASVDLTATLSSADTTFAIFANGTTAIGYNNLGTTYAPANSAKLAVNGNITTSGAMYATNGFVGNASTATKWNSAITIGMSGDVSSDSVNIDGSGNVTITNTVVANDSHTHDGRYYTETEADTRFINATGDSMTGKLTIGSGMATGSTILDFPGGAMQKMTDQGGFSFGGDSSVVIHAGDNVGSYNAYFGIVAGTTTETLYLSADGVVSLVSNMQGGAAAIKTATLAADGSFSVPGALSTEGNIKITTADAALVFDDRTGTPEEQQAKIRHEPINANNPGSMDNALHIEGTGTSPLSTGLVVQDKIYANGTQRVFADDYHPNADKWTTARTLTLDGDVSGSASIDGSANQTLTVTLGATNSPVRATELAGSIDLDTLAQVTDAGFYYQAANADAISGSNYPLEAAGSLLVQRNAGSGGYGTTQLYIGYNDEQMYVRSMYGSGAANRAWTRIFTDKYHPNADTWTTGRRLTLSGDVSGNVVIDGSANATMSVSVSNDSHTHSFLVAVDDRDVKPNTTNIGSGIKGIRAFFTSLEGMTGSAGTNYQDLLVLDTYSDTSGGNANAITIDKSDGIMRLWNAAQSATSWGTSRTVMTDDSTQRKLFKSGNTGATANQYGKVARVTIPSRYNDYQVTGALHSTSEGIGAAQSELFEFGVKQQDAFGSNPAINLDQFAFNGSYCELGYVIVQNTPNTIVDLYVKITSGYTVIESFALVETNLNRVEYYNEQTLTTTQPSGYVAATKERFFHTGYHPNADKWTTARTLTLTGDVTGSASIDGSGNVSLATTAAGVSGVLSDSGDTSTGMLVCHTTLTNNNDYLNSPISIRERAVAGAGDGEDRDSPNLNFHWGGRVSNSLWMGANAYLNWGTYSSTGIPNYTGVFRTSTFAVGNDAFLKDINVANTVRVEGQQNANNGYITFGNVSNTALGRAGSGDLTWGGVKVLTGNVTGTLFADVIAANEIYADMIAANAITAQKIQANAVTANELQISSTASVANSIFFDGANKRIDIKDASGVLRVRIGQL